MVGWVGGWAGSGELAGELALVSRKLTLRDGVGGELAELTLLSVVLTLELMRRAGELYSIPIMPAIIGGTALNSG